MKVPVFCVGCSKHVEDREVGDNHMGPNKIHGCCPDCFPPKAKVEPEVEQEEVVQEEEVVEEVDDEPVKAKRVRKAR